MIEFSQQGFRVLNINFYYYGLIIGLAIILVYQLVFFIAKKEKLDYLTHFLFKNYLMIGILLAGVVGARLWHVVTDFQFYQHDLLSILFVWRGGLSILGAIAGGLVFVVILQQLKIIKTIGLITLLDLLAFGLPVGQAVGRLANFINQEIFGLPTLLPWAIFIPMEKRPIGYENFSRFHPLFAYEFLLLLFFAAFLWIFKIKNKKSQIGSGKYFYAYVLFYGLTRFCLDFLRIEGKFFWGLGKNQIILLFLFICGMFIMYFNNKKRLNLSQKAWPKG